MWDGIDTTPWEWDGIEWDKVDTSPWDDIEYIEPERIEWPELLEWEDIEPEPVAGHPEKIGF